MFRHRSPDPDIRDDAAEPEPAAPLAGADPFYAGITSNSDREAYAMAARARSGTSLLTSSPAMPELTAAAAVPRLGVEIVKEVVLPKGIKAKIKLSYKPKAASSVEARSSGGTLSAKVTALEAKWDLKGKGERALGDIALALGKVEVGVSPFSFLTVKVSLKGLEAKMSKGPEVSLARVALEISASGAELLRFISPEMATEAAAVVDVALTGSAEVPIDPEDVVDLATLAEATDGLGASAERVAGLTEEISGLERDRTALLALHRVDDAARLPLEALERYRGIEEALAEARANMLLEAERAKIFRRSIVDVVGRLRSTSGKLAARVLGERSVARVSTAFARFARAVGPMLVLVGVAADIYDAWRVLRADRGFEPLAGPAPDEPGTAEGRGDDRGGREAAAGEATAEGTPGAPPGPVPEDAPGIPRDAIPPAGAPPGASTGAGTGVGSPTPTDAEPGRPPPDPDTDHGTPAGAAGSRPVAVKPVTARVIGMIEAARGEVLPPREAFVLDVFIPDDLSDDELAELERRLAVGGAPIGDIVRLVSRLKEMIADVRTGRPAGMDVGAGPVGDEPTGSTGGDAGAAHGDAGPATVRGLLEATGDLLDYSKGGRPVVDARARKKLVGETLVGDGLTIKVISIALGKSIPLSKPAADAVPASAPLLVPVVFTVKVLTVSPAAGVKPGITKVTITHWLSRDTGASGATVTAEEIYRALGGALTWADGKPTGVVAGKLIDIGIARVHVVAVELAGDRALVRVVPVELSSAGVGLTLDEGWTALSVGEELVLPVPLGRLSAAGAY